MCRESFENLSKKDENMGRKRIFFSSKNGSFEKQICRKKHYLYKSEFYEFLWVFLSVLNDNNSRNNHSGFRGL